MFNFNNLTDTQLQGLLSGIPNFTTPLITPQQNPEVVEEKTPEEKLSDYLSFVNNLETELEASRERGRAATAGGSLDFWGGGYFEDEDLLAIDAAGDFYDNSRASLSDYITDNNIPLYKDIDGERYFLNTGADMFGSDADTRAGSQFMKELMGTTVGGDYIAGGPVGTYSTVFQPDEGFVSGTLNNPLINLAATFVPAGQLALQGARAATGETLHLGDYISAGLSANQAGLFGGGTDAVNAAADSAGCVCCPNSRRCR